MGKKIQIAMWIIVAIIAFILIGGCVYTFVRAQIEGPIHPEVTFEIENVGKIKMELYPEYAPNTVANIIKLVEKGYYNNKILYGKDEVCLYLGRTQDGAAENPKASMLFEEIKADSEQDFEYSISGEFVANGYTKNSLRHEKGVITLIRNNYGSGLSDQSYNSGNAQIAIMMGEESSNLNGLYAAFGRITEGLDLIEKVYNEAEIVKTEENSEELTEADTIKAFEKAPVITSATVDTHGIDFGNPMIQQAFNYEEYMYQYMSSYYGEQ